MKEPLNIVILGLSITSSWGNGHATTFRGLVKALNKEGHKVTFLERDTPWYASHRDMPAPEFCQVYLYETVMELQEKYVSIVKNADLVIMGSYVPDGVAVGEWATYTAEGVTAFYDIDTPVTLAKLQKGDYEYIHPQLIPKFDIYLSFTGGPVLDQMEQQYRSPMARPFYCSVDPDLYHPLDTDIKYDLGYLGTYSDDRQPPLQALMLDAADQWPEGKFVVAGPQYPETIKWPKNCERIEHLPPREHVKFYNSQRFTLNVTRADMIAAGYAPSVRLFEAAACGVPIISDYWDGLDSLLEFDKEILISRSASDTLNYLKNISEEERKAIGERARKKILSSHTSSNRAMELIGYVNEVKEKLHNLKPI